MPIMLWVRRLTVLLAPAAVALAVAATAWTAASAAAPASAGAADGGRIRLVVDGREVTPDQPPRIVDGRTLVPIRFVAEALGVKVEYDPAGPGVRLRHARKGEFYLKLASPEVILPDGASRRLEVPARLIGGRTFVPLRFVAEAFGADVAWDEAARTVRVSTLTDDFTPPVGRAAGPPGPGAGRYGPWNTRLMTAYSDDGLTFERTRRVITDQGDVPDLVQDDRGRIYLYYVGWTVGEEQNRTVVALSDDGGSTWTFKKLKLKGFEGMAAPVDPDVQILPDGTFRLYVTSDPHDGRGPRTYYAEGRDGVTFARQGVAFARPGRPVLDPTTLRVGSTWRLFAGGTPGENWQADSPDGKEFTAGGNLILEAGGRRQMMANGIPVPGGYRFYTFSAPGPGGEDAAIHSFFSEDGRRWTVEPGARLTLDPSSGRESVFVKDPAVVRLADGRYLMVYVTGIP